MRSDKENCVVVDLSTDNAYLKRRPDHLIRYGGTAPKFCVFHRE